MRLRNVHNDKRGEIYVINEFLKDDKEITLIHTKANKARGGCNHKFNDEYHVVIEGKIAYNIGETNQVIILNKGDILKIEKNTPHYCIALEDSITIEFGTTPEEQGDRYEPFRKIVDEINERN